jgi:8-oxo-dGTP pyrophosphatase MutT (NUDIX family)
MFEPNFRIPKKTGAMNKAFQSLSFRGKCGYSQNIMKKSINEPNKEQIKQKTYGGIIRVKNNMYKDLERNTKYALVRGSYTGKWSFPKGHSNEGECAMACTMREIGEETGIDVLPPPLEFIHIGYGNYYVFDLDEQVPLIPRDTHEIMDTKWVTLDEMLRMPLNADVSFYVRNKLKTLSE